MIHGQPASVGAWPSAAQSAVLQNPTAPAAWVGGQLATDLVEVTDDPTRLDSSGRWVVCLTFEGRLLAARFRDWSALPVQLLPDDWVGPSPDSWTSSLTQDGYEQAVAQVREHIGRGEVYQANICRILNAPLAAGGRPPDPLALLGRLLHGNPAPHAGAVRIPSESGEPPLWVAGASPELYLSRKGSTVLTRPIKGTTTAAGKFLDKDIAENVMIVDLVRNDLGRICEPGSITVPEFLVREQHPGLAHLVSGVQGIMRRGARWTELLEATFPPGSVTGAPKQAALQVISACEPVPRGPYCGAFGWVDSDTGEAELAVSIRTFWAQPDEWGQLQMSFGTGAGITWGSDPRGEWEETALKARRLVALASSADGEAHLARSGSR